MPQSLVKNMIHLVFSTKQRQPWIATAHRDGLFAYQAGIYREWDSPALVIGGVEDHVHENQEDHHRRMTFQDELRALFGRHGIKFDERFVWD
jgi:hypothetical protein